MNPGAILSRCPNVESYADRKVMSGYRGVLKISRVKASLLAKGIGPRSVRNDLTLGVSRHTQLAAAVLIPLRRIASSCEGSTS